MLVKSILDQKPTGVFTVSETASFIEAARTMTIHRVGALPVVSIRNSLIGVVMESDIVRLVGKHGESVLKASIGEYIQRNVLFCEPKDEITEVALKMTDLRVRYLPVIDEGKLIGIISIGDVAKAQQDILKAEAEALRDYISKS